MVAVPLFIDIMLNVNISIISSITSRSQVILIHLYPFHCNFTLLQPKLPKNITKLSFMV